MPAYTEVPPDDYFPHLDDVKTIDDLTRLAQLYEFQINSMAADPDGRIDLDDDERTRQIVASIGVLDAFAKRLGLMHELIEITGMAIVPSAESANINAAALSYDCHAGQYLGFNARQDEDESTGLRRYQFGHFFATGEVFQRGFVRHRHDILHGFVSVHDVERIETPTARKQRVACEIAGEFPPDDAILHDIDELLFNCPEQVDIRPIAKLFNTKIIGKQTPAVVDRYLAYLNLQIDIDQRQLSLLCPYAYWPSRKQVDVLQSSAEIQGLARSFCLGERIIITKAKQAVSTGQMQLYLSVEVPNQEEGSVVLVPAHAISLYVVEESEVA